MKTLILNTYRNLRKRHIFSYIVISLISLIFIYYSNNELKKDYAATKAENATIKEQNTEILHALKELDAYRNKGLYEAGIKRENAYYDIRTRYERVLKIPECKLPNDLAVIPASQNFESLESILMKGL